MNRARFVLMLCLVLLGSAWGQDARAWWNNDWEFRKEITFDLSPAGADIAGAPADVPVLIRLSLANFQYFADAKSDGSDFVFISGDDKTPLKYHIERFDSQAQIAFVWVRMPHLTGGAKTDKIFLYYGNKKATSGGDAAGSYDTPQALVYHFGAPAGSAQDSTGYKTEPTKFTAEVNPASLIGSGAKFAGGQVISIPATGAAHLAAGKGFTVSLWARIDAAQSDAYLAQLADQGRELVLGLSGTQAYARYVGGSAPVTIQQSGQLATGEWHHLALRVGDGHLTLLVDGNEAGQSNITQQEIAGALTIGGSAAGAHFYSGELDELEVANTARSTDWIKAAARSQGMVAPLVVYGGDAQKEGGNESYFVTTLRNVTVDGWVIISILSVMFVAAMLIMAVKTVFLSRVGSGNRKFLDEFNRLADDPAALESRLGKSEPDSSGASLEAGGAFGVSTLWPVYHHGMRETMKRLEGRPASADRVRTLSTQSIEAIRASLDATVIRLVQRLNGQMVWLTIAIAGGPFLGLLGTVVGVMITFAAIAQSGDVNINAIAPGTAAALVATVAGLGVAIPCLFGYNYLNTRVKEISAEMRVFADEFVARIAETYS
ncbi:MAG: MotA/TolQ/ExbB proton channel family protein [Gammaproteobacteria bacterium]|jgi:biopolymer transport protein ExbB|nr:MotA/TolQ/ExbB proton channel family protein [Gammaproteobacteria bacterium]